MVGSSNFRSRIFLNSSISCTSCESISSSASFDFERLSSVLCVCRSFSRLLSRDLRTASLFLALLSRYSFDPVVVTEEVDEWFRFLLLSFLLILFLDIVDRVDEVMMDESLSEEESSTLEYVSSSIRGLMVRPLEVTLTLGSLLLGGILVWFLIPCFVMMCLLIVIWLVIDRVVDRVRLTYSSRRKPESWIRVEDGSSEWCHVVLLLQCSKNESSKTWDTFRPWVSDCFLILS